MSAPAPAGAPADTVVNAGASAEAIRHHYDVSDAFYALWLDRSLTYTCALWGEDGDPAETLERAQERKLDHLITGARATGAQRVLDVGCGWGSMLRRLTQVHGVGHAVGVTLSESQAAWYRRGPAERTEMLLESWQEHRPQDGGYDAVVSIGAFEHFAAPGLPRAERVAVYREFFDRCAQWLPVGGRLALQTCVKGNNVVMDRRTVADLLFIMGMIFPESEIPAVSEIVEASERTFDIVGMRNDPDHYARTAGVWHERLLAHRTEAVEIAGDTTVAHYERYLSSSVEHFRNRHLGLSRFVFEKVR